MTTIPARLTARSLAAVTLAVLAVPLLSQVPSLPSGDSLCFSFLLRGDLAVNCGVRRTGLLHRSDVSAYAVDRPANFLAVIYGQSGFAPVSDRTTILDLRSGKRRTIAGPTSALPTCGGILSWAGPSAWLNRDVVTGQKHPEREFERFRCSADSSVVIGVPHGSSVLIVRQEGTRRAVPGGNVEHSWFDISPDGARTAFLDRGSLCVSNRLASPVCVQTYGSPDPISVDESGGVLFSTGTGEACEVASATNFAPEMPRGIKTLPDECSGIAYWRPGMVQPRLLEPLGRSPQWINREVPSALKRFLSR